MCRGIASTQEKVTVMDSRSFLKFGLCIFVHLLSVGFTGGAITKCDKLSSCSCLTNNGMVVDLSPLSSSGDPRFKDMPAPSGDLFSWNPCSAFSEGGLTGLAACQKKPTIPTMFYNIGSQESAAFRVDPSNGLQLIYNATTDVLRVTKVTLQCDSSIDYKLTVQGEIFPGSAVYEFLLSSKYCCEGEATVTVVALSIGSILIIVFFSVLLVYLLTGSVVQKYGRKASGLEILPNYGFWSSVPGYIKSGFIFSGSCFKRSRTYDKI